jgi:asparagine synthetase B (glutamine-hydrolysing)
VVTGDAFVIWDERNQPLIAGCDRFGVKPLFYAEHSLSSGR